ncbi:MAG: hemolysin family protein [Flavobacteriaceae bacterium]
MNTYLLVIALSLVLSAFFSGMEIAFVSANRIHIEIEKKQDSFLAGILRRLTASPSKFIASMLIGNNLALVVYGYYMGKVLMATLPQGLASDPYWQQLVFEEFQLLTHTVISTLVILFTAEFTPKVFFQIYANTLLKALAVPAYLFFVLFSGFSWLVIRISDTLLRLFKAGRIDQSDMFSKVELGDYISQQLQSAKDDQELDSEIHMFQNALEFAEVKAREIMVPRNEITAIELHDNINELRQLFIETGYSKILVYRDTIDDIIGHVHSFDLFKKPRSLRTITKPVEYVPETMLVHDILNALIKKRRGIAIVLDEYGGTSGMLTIEDIVEELFGEIEDEHDTIEYTEEQIGSHTFLFSGRLEVDYLNEKYKLELPENDEYETLAGLVMSYTEEIPEVDTEIRLEKFVFTVIEVSQTRIEKVRLKRLQDED